MNHRICLQKSPIDSPSYTCDILVGDKNVGSGQLGFHTDRIVFLGELTQLWFTVQSTVMHAIANDDAGRKFLFIQLDEDDEESEEETIVKIYFSENVIDEVFAKLNEVSAQYGGVDEGDEGDEEFEAFEDDIE